MELTYERLEDRHAEALLPLWSDPETIRFTGIQRPCTLAEVRDRVAQLKGFDVFAVRGGETVIGIIGCPCIDRNTAQYGIFYHFHRNFWGQGHATAAAGWLIRFMETTYPAPVLVADVAAENTASEKILQKYGFAFLSEEETLRRGETLCIRNYRRAPGESGN